jgi:hypothetical protein
VRLLDHYRDEKAAVADLREALHSRFTLISEVKLRHWSGESLFIDLVGLPRLDWPNVQAIGFEVKKGYEKFGEFNEALRQAVDYAESEICDPRAHRLDGRSLDYVFVFPDFGSKRESTYEAGALRLAGKFGVGVVEEKYEFTLKKDIWRLNLCSHPLLTETGELSGNALNFAKRRKIGNHKVR